MRVTLCKDVLDAMVSKAGDLGVKNGVAVITVCSMGSRKMRSFSITLGDNLETVRDQLVNHWGRANMKVANMLTTHRASGVNSVGAVGETGSTGGFVRFTSEGDAIYLAFDGGTAPQELAVTGAGIAVITSATSCGYIPSAFVRQ